MEKRTNVFDNVQDREHSIPFMGGRPDRDTIINQDDITNVVIALNTSETITDFVNNA